jgi:hypothetical protein
MAAVKVALDENRLGGAGIDVLEVEQMDDFVRGLAGTQNVRTHQPPRRATTNYPATPYSAFLRGLSTYVDSRIPFICTRLCSYSYHRTPHGFQPRLPRSSIPSAFSSASVWRLDRIGKQQSLSLFQGFLMF